MPARYFTDEEEVCIAQLYKAGNSMMSIASAYGLSSKMAIQGALHRTGTKSRPNTEANRLYTINHNAFDEFTQESVYWWGFIYADGFINRHKSLSVALKHSDIDHLVMLNKFLQSNAPIQEMNNHIGKRKYKVARLHVTSQHMGKRLEELGIIVRRPAFQLVLENLPLEFTHHWLRGLFDGDGSVRTFGIPGLGFCGARPLVEFVRFYLAQEANTNPKLKIYQHETGLCYIRYSGRRQSVRVAGALYKDATIWLKRKRDVIESWPEPQTRERDELGRYI